jgi:hypothetical protein
VSAADACACSMVCCAVLHSAFVTDWNLCIDADMGARDHSSKTTAMFVSNRC